MANKKPCVSNLLCADTKIFIVTQGVAVSREMYMLMFFGELGSTLNAAHMRFDLYHPCIDHLPMVYTMKQLHVLGMHMLMSCLARGAWLTHAHTLCAVIVCAVTFLRRD